MLVGYARVSTHAQNLELQIDALKSAGCEKIFEESASGASAARLELQSALTYVRGGDTLVIWKLDRLARSLKQLIDTVEALHRREIGFKSLTESIDTTTPGGKLIFHVFGALAEFERGIIRERTIAGIQAARARGWKGGRPRVLNAEKLIAAKALLRDGNLPVRDVARQLGVSEATLYTYIPSPRTTCSQ